MNCFEILHKQIQRRHLCEGRGSGEGGNVLRVAVFLSTSDQARTKDLSNISFSEQFSSLLFVLLSFSPPTPN